jgi:hypothetical protein
VIYEWDPKKARSGDNMKKVSARKKRDGLRREYDLSQLKGGVRGKYYRQAITGTNLVLIEAKLAEIFPDAASVNRALRLLADTAGAAARRSGRRKAPNKAMQPTRDKVARG